MNNDSEENHGRLWVGLILMACVILFFCFAFLLPFARGTIENPDVLPRMVALHCILLLPMGVPLLALFVDHSFPIVRGLAPTKMQFGLRGALWFIGMVAIVFALGAQTNVWRMLIVFATVGMAAFWSAQLGLRSLRWRRFAGHS